MSDLGEAIRDYVVAQSSVSTLIADRFRPDELDQKDIVPAATFHRISTTHMTSLDGTDVLLANSIIEVAAYGNTRQQAISVCDAIRRCGLLSLRGVYSGVSIRHVAVIGGRRDYTEPPIDGTHEMRYVASQDFRVFYEDPLT